MHRDSKNIDGTVPLFTTMAANHQAGPGNLPPLPPLQIPPPPGPPQAQGPVMAAIQIIQPQPAVQQQGAGGQDFQGRSLMCPSNFKVLTDLQGKSTCVTLLSPRGPWIQLPLEFVASVSMATEHVPITEMVLKRHQLRCLPPNFSSLINLAVLDLSYNHLECVPEAICRLVKLELLYLQHNSICEVPDSFGMLAQLKELQLQHNKLATVPTGVCQCTALQILNVDFNVIQYLSEDIGLLRNLKRLSATSNILQQLPVTINQMKLLEELYLANNELGQLSELPGLTALKQLHLAGNKLDGLPLSILQLQLLEGITLTGNPMKNLPMAVRRKGISGIRQYMEETQGHSEESLNPHYSKIPS